ncbi:hypothetical protein CAP50_00655 [Psychrobacter sp. L7]|nr:hypothetical protein BTV99_05480 [Psychrobacter sp. Rd 27.2]PJX27066.1 hypothetical protein CAP50_00655 [Psychrobacter sp. L7]
MYARLYKAEQKKHQAQPNIAFIIHKAVLSIKEWGIKDSVLTKQSCQWRQVTTRIVLYRHRA